MKTLIWVVITFSFARIMFELGQADTTIHWSEVLKNLGFTSAVVVGVMTGVWKAMRFLIERHDNLVVMRNTRNSIEALHAKSFIPKVVSGLGDSLNAHKAIAYRLANGDDKLNPSKNFKISVLHEDVFNGNAPAANKLQLVREDYQDFLIDEGFFQHMENLMSKGVIILNYNDLSSDKLMNMWEPQQIKSAVLIWVGALPTGFIYLSMQYQIKKEALTANEKRHIDVALNQLRDLYKMDHNQFRNARPT